MRISYFNSMQSKREIREKKKKNNDIFQFPIFLQKKKKKKTLHQLHTLTTTMHVPKTPQRTCGSPPTFSVVILVIDHHQGLHALAHTTG